MTNRIAVVGAGAVGGYVGAGLAAHGYDVTLIDPWPAHVEAILAGGIRLSGMTEAETRTVRVNALHLTEVQRIAREAPIDIAFISVKSYDTEWATMLIAPYLSARGFVVSMQNCVNEERVAGIVGWGRTVGCVVSGGLALDLYEPAHIRRTMARRADLPSLYVGEPHGQITPARRRPGADAERGGHRARHRQSLGRALDQAVRQRDAQRRLRRDRPRRQRARQP